MQNSVLPKSGDAKFGPTKNWWCKIQSYQKVDYPCIHEWSGGNHLCIKNLVPPNHICIHRWSASVKYGPQGGPSMSVHRWSRGRPSVYRREWSPHFWIVLVKCKCMVEQTLIVVSASSTVPHVFLRWGRLVALETCWSALPGKLSALQFSEWGRGPTVQRHACKLQGGLSIYINTSW